MASSNPKLITPNCSFCAKLLARPPFFSVSSASGATIHLCLSCFYDPNCAISSEFHVTP